MTVLENKFQQITSIDALFRAHKMALKGKRNNYYATEFDHNLITKLLNLQCSLRSFTYQPMKYREKTIFEPKVRRIEAPSYRDRIVHHAIHEQLSPFFERIFINDSYACRIGRGIHGAAQRTQHFLRSGDQNLYACQLDISKFYASINHKKLTSLICKRIDNPPLINLINIIIESTDSGHRYDEIFPNDSYYHTRGRRGLPIGNLTSQLFANIYLHEADNYAKQDLKIRQYIRYMDDIVFFCKDKSQILSWQKAMIDFLYNELFLTVNPRKVRLYPAKQGVSFVGYKIYPNYLLLRGSSVRRFKKHYRKQLNSVSSGLILRDELDKTFNAFKAHAAHASTERLIANLESWQNDYLQPRKFTQLSLFDDKDLF